MNNYESTIKGEAGTLRATEMALNAAKEYLQCAFAGSGFYSETS